MAVATEARWKLAGTLLIACDCDFGCPCNFNALPSHGKCEGGWPWHVEEGAVGDHPSEEFRLESEIAYAHSGQVVAAAPFDYAGA